MSSSAALSPIVPAEAGGRGATGLDLEGHVSSLGRAMGLLGYH
jgi:hypothetical protein